MANKAKKTKKSSASTSDSNVVRIKASSAPSTKKVAAEEKVTKVVASTGTTKAKKVNPPAGGTKRKLSGKGALRPVKATGNYFKGAWDELRLVRWPSRRATWGLTGAVILYSLFFVVLVLLLDAIFKYLFELILGK